MWLLCMILKDIIINYNIGWSLLMKKFEEILKDLKVKIQTDEGGEFEKIKKELSPTYGFTLYHTYNCEIKASIVEAVIKTLKLMVRRTIGVTQNKTYVKAMKIIVDVYNHCIVVLVVLRQRKSTKEKKKTIALFTI